MIMFIMACQTTSYNTIQYLRLDMVICKHLIAFRIYNESFYEVFSVLTNMNLFIRVFSYIRQYSLE